MEHTDEGVSLEMSILFLFKSCFCKRGKEGLDVHMRRLHIQFCAFPWGLRTLSYVKELHG